MSERNFDQEIGETMLHTLPEGSGFIVIYFKDRGETRMVSNIEPELMATVMARQALLISQKEFSEAVRYMKRGIN
jgi:hypothetical protein